MNFDDYEIIKILENDNFNLYDKKIIYKLYYLNKKKPNLIDLEERIYTIDDIVVPDETRIEMAINELKNKAKKYNNDSITKVIATLELLFNKGKGNLSPSLIAFMKKVIVEMQISLNESVTFYSVIQELLDEKMLSLKNQNKRG